MEAYCVRCKAKKEMKDPVETKMKNGKPAVTGTCVTCGTKMFKIGASTSTESK
jgi:RNase P subunit RPR2